MICEGFQDIIDEYLDGVVRGKELQELQQHLSGCSACRQEVEELQSTLSWLKQAGDVVPPAGLRQSVLAELKNDQTRKGRFYFPGLSQVVAAAAVLIVLLAGNIYLLPPAADNDPLPFKAAYEAESGEAAFPEGATIFSKEGRAIGQTNEKTETSPVASARPFIGRLILNLVLGPLFLFFVLLILQKRKEARR